MVGRSKETKELEKRYNSTQSEFVAIYGRRRIGKTYLVRETFGDRFTFAHTGVARGTQRRQLTAFRRSLKKAGLKEVGEIKDWFEAFDLLEDYVETLSAGKKVLFLDELPWMDTGRGDFIGALEHFWNGWASARKDVLLIVCGSATSWMINKVIKDKGGLHNRVTCNVFLRPFTLAECRLFAREKRLSLTNADLAELYMAIGGVPFYWTYLESGMSAAQNFDLMFFGDTAKMRNEFGQLYASLFKRPETYLKIVTALATKKIGMTRDELVAAAHVSKNGKLTLILEELEQCGFVRRYTDFVHRKNDAVYQLVDAFTLFYFRFMHGESNADPHYWSTHTRAPVVASWRGIAFERLCLAHVDQIKAALGISGVSVRVFAWSHRPQYKGDRGCQIDLLIDRDDNVINVCEMKFTGGRYDVGEREALDLETKLDVLRRVSKTQKAVHLTMVTAHGLTENPNGQCVQSTVTLDDLFTGTKT